MKNSLSRSTNGSNNVIAECGDEKNIHDAPNGAVQQCCVHRRTASQRIMEDVERQGFERLVLHIGKLFVAGNSRSSRCETRAVKIQSCWSVAHV